MKKKDVVDRIVEALRAKVALHLAAARAAHDEATHEDMVAEDKYDTRGLEASYLADGQARQMEEVANAHQEYAALFLKKFAPTDPIDVSALVVLEMKKKQFVYFVGPSAGGTEVECDGETVLVITPQSPLGKQLVGRKRGDTFKLKIGPFTDEYKVVSVS